LLDSVRTADKTLHELNPSKNKKEFAHYRLMGDIRLRYVEFEYILHRVNEPSFTATGVPPILRELKGLIDQGKTLDTEFIALNKGYMHDTELKQENDLRNARIQLLYDRLSRKN